MPFESCDYDLDKYSDSHKMIIKCKECKNDFDVDICLPGMILALQNEYNIDNLVLSDYIERQYTDEALQILIEFKDIVEELKVFSSRKTLDNNCKNCVLKPKDMYQNLTRSLLDNSDDIFKKLISYSKKLIEKDGCIECRTSAKEELSILADKLIDIRSKILLEAYNILE